MQNGPVERYLVLEDGMTTLLEKAPKTLAERWSLRVGCGGGCLAWIVGSAVVGAFFGDDWYVVPVALAVVFVVVGEALARHTWGNVERFLESREGTTDGWSRF